MKWRMHIRYRAHVRGEGQFCELFVSWSGEGDWSAKVEKWDVTGNGGVLASTVEDQFRSANDARIWCEQESRQFLGAGQ